MNKQKKEIRPYLDENISIEDFLDFYWLKVELQDFCRKKGMRTSGAKTEIAERIIHYLKTGERPQAVKSKTVHVYAAQQKKEASMSLETVIEADFKCTQEHREFFKRVIGPKFHFSVALQNYLKANAGKTYQDVVDHYYQLEEDKKKGKRTTISGQFEYNTFIRAYFDDSANKGKSLQDAISAWKKVWSRRGDNVYRSVSEAE
ncbi:DUF6434 domain-containing protein [Oceanobacillus sp. FSL W7-1293]|uniref:DUF6434 domain-containing protein n=1 Tax=Oceanobacillus sp. FSL W7-1293 TaxID=2921699 RepID=UPI0030D252A8